MTLATLIVVTHNTARWCARQKAALEAQTDKRWALVVIDNASTPSQRPNAGDFPAGAQIIQNETNLGFAAANNRAASACSTPFLIFLNPDAFPAPTWFAELVQLAEACPRAAAIGSTQMRDGSPGVLDGVGDVLHASGLAYRAGYGRHAIIPPLGESFAVCGAAMLVRREAFEAIDGFDERYFCYFEDIDLCFRLRLGGARILQSPGAVVAHVGGGSIDATSAFSQFHGARNRLWTFVKCMPGAMMWLLLPLHFAAAALVATLAAIRGRGLHAWRGIIEGVLKIGPIFAARRAVQRNRKASLGEIASVLAWSPEVLLSRRALITPIRK